MLYDDSFRNPDGVPAILERLQSLSAETGPVNLMEICGTHTAAIAKSGIRSLLPKDIHLLSGPGCPVCVTPAGAIDEILRLSERPDTVIASYGDLLRVPGTVRGDSLLRRKALGAMVEPVYSSMDAVALAAAHPDREIIFLGVGFETTAPGTAACILEAAARKLSNFSVLPLLKRTEPALRALIKAPDFAVSGFLCPGHVAAVTGSRFFSFLPKEFGLPAVVSGFEAADLLYSILELMKMLKEKRPALENEYLRLVKPEGNPAALHMIEQVFEPAHDVWRGLGPIPESGFAVRKEYEAWDASVRFDFRPKDESEIPGCRCSDVIRGLLAPEKCPMFGNVCTPTDPVGPCMVSAEGACAAAFKYRI